MISIKRTICAGLAIAVISIAGTAQNAKTNHRLHNAEHKSLIAGQRNIQHEIQMIDSIGFYEKLKYDEEEPELDIYEEGWNSRLVNPYGGMDIPNTARIDVSRYCIPHQGPITSNYGYRPRFRRVHKGIDIGIRSNDTIRAAFSGKVRLTNYEPGGYGNYVILRHENGLETVYGHLNRFMVRPNQYVKAGDPIALGGSTGHSTGPHLHFETRYYGLAINPRAIFDFEHRTTHTDEFAFNKNTYTKSVNYTLDVKQNKSSNNNNGTKYRTHRVKKGESLTKIANKYGTTVSNLRKINKLSASSKLPAGKVLKVN